MSKYVTGLIVILILITGFVWWTQKDESQSTVSNITDSNEAVNTATPAIDEEPAKTEQAVLLAVGGYAGSGLATRTVEGDFVHEITVTLDDPAEGDFYEGWLVGPTVISTGMMVDKGNGSWSLIFTSEQDLSEHNLIVITEETGANGLDGIPEDHVLEGSF